MPQLDQLISPAELGRRLGVSLRTVERMRSDGSGPPFYRVSGGLRRGRVAYSTEGVDAWLAKRCRQNTIEKRP
jgi:predicted DNA-binding transcriptional regulator AlpA